MELDQPNPAQPHTCVSSYSHLFNLDGRAMTLQAEKEAQTRGCEFLHHIPAGAETHRYSVYTVPRTPHTPALTHPHGKSWRQIRPHTEDRGAARAPRSEYTACWWQRPVRNSGVSDFTAQLLTQLFHPSLNRTEKSP